MTERAVALLLLAVLLLPARARGDTLELRFDPGQGERKPVFGLAGSVPGRAPLIVCLRFAGNPVPGSFRRVRADRLLQVTWSAGDASVLPGEYEAVAALDSGARPEVATACVYVGDPGADAAGETEAAERIRADARELAALASEVAATTSSAGASVRHPLVARVHARLVELAAANAERVPPAVFAARFADLEARLQGTIAELLASVEQHARDEKIDIGKPRLGGRAPLGTPSELARHAAGLEAAIARSRAGRSQGPRGVDRLARDLEALLARKENGDGDAERHLRIARVLRLVERARSLAGDPAAAAFAGGREALEGLEQDVGGLGVSSAEIRDRSREAVKRRLGALDVRLTPERKKRQAELERVLAALEGLAKEPGAAGWESRHRDALAAAEALPRDQEELVEGARDELLGLARVLARRHETPDVPALEAIVRDSLGRARALIRR